MFPLCGNCDYRCEIENYVKLKVSAFMAAVSMAGVNTFKKSGAVRHKKCYA